MLHLQLLEDLPLLTTQVPAPVSACCCSAPLPPCVCPPRLRACLAHLLSQVPLELRELALQEAQVVLQAAAAPLLRRLHLLRGVPRASAAASTPSCRLPPAHGRQWRMAGRWR